MRVGPTSNGRRDIKKVVEKVTQENLSVEVPDPVQEIKAEEVFDNITPEKSAESAEPPVYSLGNHHGYVYLEVELDSINIGAKAKKIALMTQKGATFFGEITDDPELLKQSVLEGDVWRVYGTKRMVSAQLNFWLDEYMASGLTQCIQFVCNVGTYKFPAFIDVLTNGEGAAQMKSYITPICYELTVDICNAVSMFTPNMKEYPLQSAFVFDNRQIVFMVKGEDFEIKADEKVVNDLIVTSIVHKAIWNIA